MMQFFSYRIIFIVAFIALVFVYVAENRVSTQNKNYETQPSSPRTDTYRASFSVEPKRDTPPKQPAQQSQSAPTKKEAPPSLSQSPVETKTDTSSQKLLSPVTALVSSTTQPNSPYAPISQSPTSYIPSFQNPNQYVKSVIQLRCPNIIDPSQIIAGSGTIIDTVGYILTNKHLILGFNQSTASFYAGRNCIVYMAPPDDLWNPKPVYTATLVAILKNYDAAILRIVKDANGNILNPPFDISPLPAKDVLPKVGDRIFTIGYPAVSGQAFHITTGLVAGLETDNGQDFIGIDALISAGNSGGALLNTDGQIIGIPTATKNGQSGGYALEIHDIFSWMNSIIQETKNISSQDIIARSVDIR